MLTWLRPCDIISLACEHADNKAEQPLSPAGTAEQVQKSDQISDRMYSVSGLLQVAYFILWVIPGGVAKTRFSLL